MAAAAVETVGVDDSFYRFILSLQSVSEIKPLWILFLEEAGKRIKLKQAELIYRTGILFEFLGFGENGLTHKTLSSYSFLALREDFDYKITKKKMVIFRQIGNYSSQMELETKGANFSETLDEAGKNQLLGLIHVFFNQLFLLLRLKDFEIHSVKDDITMAYNQNYLKAFIQNEIERSRRYAAVFSIIFFDLDNLKAINEAHGHLVGTEVLKEVAGVLRSQVRRMDVLSRFGGDEFVIVLLHADAKKGYDVCVRIKEALKKHVFLKNKDLNIKVTGCFGIASFPENGDSVEELIRKADLAMYEVKRTGKDGIKIFQGDE